MSCEDDDDQCRQLLRSLKGTAEGLLASHTANVWSVYGGLTRMHSAVLKILQHGLHVYTPKGDPDCWSFVEALQWLQPSLAISPPFRPTMHDASVTSACSSSSDDARSSLYSDWLYRSLETHSLSVKLSWLLSDANHLEKYYSSSAFLRKQKYAEAALICLRAVEQGQPSLLTDLDPRLYLSQWTSKHFVRSHRRCSSFPDNIRSGCLPPNKLGRKARETRRATTIPHIRTQLSCQSRILTPGGLFRQWNSEPTLLKSIIPTEMKVRSRGRSATTSAFPRQKVSVSVQQKIKSLLSVDTSKNIDIQKCGQEKLSISTTEHDNNIFEDADTNLTASYISTEESKVVIELASEACEETCVNLEDKEFLKKNYSQNVTLIDGRNDISNDISQIMLDDEAYKGSAQALPIEISMKRPTNLSLSLNASTDVKLKTSTPRRASDTAVGIQPRFTISNGDILDDVRPTGQLFSTDESTKIHAATSNSELVESNVIPEPEYITESPKQTTEQQGYKKVPSDPAFLTTIASELTPPVYGIMPVIPCYTPSSSASLSPPFLPLQMAEPLYSMPFSQTNFLSNSFLASSGRFSDPAEELGRENAHFSVSEAMIAAIERAKCERIERGNTKTRSNLSSTQAEDTANSEEDDDAEIAHLQERIRARRREKEQREKRRQLAKSRRILRAKRLPEFQALQSDGRTDTATPNTTTATDVSDPSSSRSPSSLESEPDESSKDIPVDSDRPGAPTDNLARIRDAGLTVSLASLYSESELAARQSTARFEESGSSSKWSRSAEGVAWGLLRQFSSRALPRDSDLQWLVSEQDAPQRLLPLPSSWPVSPDEAENEDMSRATPLRGNMQWAPPRPQIIFTPHPRPNRKFLLSKQSYLCAGCGMKVEPQYSNKFRYCEYLGRYFCTGCHGNQLAVIPGKVLDKWDFTRLQTMFCHESPHLTIDPELYSMKDLIDIHNGTLLTRLQEIINASINHVATCELCTARGFVCELCHSRDVIFPWDVKQVVRCQYCGCCIHLKCWKSSGKSVTSPSSATPDDCPRCLRIRARRINQSPLAD